MLKIGVVGAPLLPGGDPRIFGTPGETREEANGGRCERKDPRSRLRVGEVELTRLEVGVFPPQRLDFGEPAACQHEETDRGHRRSSLRAILVNRVKHAPESGEFVPGQEPIAHLLLVAFGVLTRVRAVGAQAPKLGEVNHLRWSVVRPPTACSRRRR